LRAAGGVAGNQTHACWFWDVHAYPPASMAGGVRVEAVLALGEPGSDSLSGGVDAC